jgi:hypothetical protein
MEGMARLAPQPDAHLHSCASTYPLPEPTARRRRYEPYVTDVNVDACLRV